MTENKELNQRFDTLEKRLDEIACSNTRSALRISNSIPDEIDLRELFSILWEGKAWIVGITFLFAVAGIIYSFSLPNIYKSEGIYAPAKKDGGGQSVAGQFGGLAAIAGISLGGSDSNDIDQAITLFSSWPFLEMVANKYELKPLVLGVKSWDSDTRELVWDDSTYDAENKKWLPDSAEGKAQEPSSYETYLAFKSMLTITYDSKINLIKVQVEHYSPVVAQAWVELLVSEINLYFKTRDKADAKRNIEYLQEKVSETSIAEMRTVFFDMIETQLKTLMLAEVGDEYLLKNVVQPKEAELKSSPKRAVLVLLSIIAGGVMSVMFIFIKFFIGRGV
ncbi:Wzz/FepE/Etk N-terminal domain-containing protein [Teredinibacter turnerae]|uniref:Wzz/FepE/Etk N-terminal domain-containing protein n=1 Tax=Teredinibacter turnerae TaxID=2426 RepID=UPI0030D2C287